MANQEAPFEVWVGNLRKYTEGNLTGEWVSFPQSEEELQKIVEDIAGANNDELIIMDISARADCAYLVGMIGEWAQMEDLNIIAKLIGNEPHPEVEAYLEHVEQVSAQELANLLMQKEKIPYHTYTFSGSDNPKVMDNLTDEEKLGYEMLERDAEMLRMLEALPMGTSNVLSYINVSDIGRDLSYSGDYSPDENGYYNLLEEGPDLEYYTMEEIKEHLVEKGKSEKQEQEIRQLKTEEKDRQPGTVQGQRRNQKKNPEIPLSL